MAFREFALIEGRIERIVPEGQGSPRPESDGIHNRSNLTSVPPRRARSASGRIALSRASVASLQQSLVV